MTTNLRKGKFSIDGVVESAEIYEGFTNGSVWNGWANIFMDLAEAKRFFGDALAADGIIRYDGMDDLAPEFNAELGVVVYDLNGYCFVELTPEYLEEVGAVKAVKS